MNGWLELDAQEMRGSARRGGHMKWHAALARMHLLRVPRLSLRVAGLRVAGLRVAGLRDIRGGRQES